MPNSIFNFSSTVFIQALFLLILSLFVHNQSLAQDTSCSAGTFSQHTFPSGASWSLCASVNETHGLALSNVYYRAPGDTSRSVMAQANVAQILLHYHDQANADPQITPSADTTGESAPLVLRHTADTCLGEILTVDATRATVCSIIKNNRILAKYTQRPSLQSESWELSSTLLRESLTWSISWTFTEDGQIRPTVAASGRASRTQLDSQFSQNERGDIPRLTRASILATWRLVTALDTASNDRVQQFDFPLNVDNENRRPMQITPINEESLLNIDRELFRGWRILDVSGAGYYLDPANQGYSYSSTEFDWANYEVAFTRYNECEKYASGYTDSMCGNTLNDYANSESLSDQNPVMWYSQSQLLTPGIEDWPVLGDVHISFDLLPFDWTDTSPFEVVE